MKGCLKAECYKFFSTRGCLCGLFLAICLPIAIFLYVNFNQEVVNSNHILNNSLLAYNFFSIGIILFSAYFWGEEYQSNMLRTTFLSTANRLRVIQSKLFVLCLIVLLTFFFLSILLFFLAISFDYQSKLILSTQFLNRILLILISSELLAFITSGFSILFKSTYLSIALLFSLQIGGSQMLFSMIGAAKFLPDLAVVNLYTLTSQSAFLAIHSGLLVQSVWAVSAIIILFLLFLKRDLR